jgi:hypothetical protein
MLIYIGFDDTDIPDAERGTGKLARWFEAKLPPTCRLWGVVRQQLLLDDAIPYTSHNSSACVVVESPDHNPSLIDDLTLKAIDHIERLSLPGSDPGLCLCYEGHLTLSKLISFGRECATRILTQKDALQAAMGTHLSGHGGTHNGIIGAAAAVGLTAYGWSGRFIEFGKLRDFPEEVSVSDLERAGIAVVSLDREATVPDPEDLVNTNGWLRPRLWGGKPGLPVTVNGKSRWQSLGVKHKKEKEGKRRQ